MLTDASAAMIRDRLTLLLRVARSTLKEAGAYAEALRAPVVGALATMEQTCSALLDAVEHPEKTPDA